MRKPKKIRIYDEDNRHIHTIADSDDERLLNKAKKFFNLKL